MFGDFYESEDEEKNSAPEPSTSDRLAEAEERIARLTRTLHPLVQDQRWQLPPEPQPRYVQQTDHNHIYLYASP